MHLAEATPTCYLCGVPRGSRQPMTDRLATHPSKEIDRVVYVGSNQHLEIETVKAWDFYLLYLLLGWLGSRVVGVLDSGAEGPGFKSQSPRCRVTVLGKLFTPIVPLFTKQQNWSQPS